MFTDESHQKHVINGIYISTPIIHVLPKPSRYFLKVSVKEDIAVSSVDNQIVYRGAPRPWVWHLHGQGVGSAAWTRRAALTAAAPLLPAKLWVLPGRGQAACQSHCEAVPELSPASSGL